MQVQREGRDADEAEADDLIGVYETLGGVPVTGAASVAEPGAGLRFLRSELFDLLADHIDLVQGMASGLMQTRVTASRGS